ncbi:helix-turn-helix transcriptional regulator [uncultured Muriicola sp.]|uniref:helix-turn-helix transcriptional regulator n=1 Tax=uncultured Muriicola sp. TaxID=1583102 RepID=UPI0026047298|nr:helix-turn-helix transcriptional regulator [uncultured Muriicola sp.]
MVNSEEFVTRLEKILTFYNLSASSFADKIGVQRSSISHLLTGRNKPSLEFVMKVVTSYPEVNLYWLLNGKGSFPAKKESTASPSLSSPTPIPSTSRERTIEKIIILYTDGSFETFEPSIINSN